MLRQAHTHDIWRVHKSHIKVGVRAHVQIELLILRSRNANGQRRSQANVGPLPHSSLLALASFPQLSGQLGVQLRAHAIL